MFSRLVNVKIHNPTKKSAKKTAKDDCIDFSSQQLSTLVKVKMLNPTKKSAEKLLNRIALMSAVSSSAHR